MIDVLFVTWDGGGNLPPALAIAAELRRRGRTVSVLGHESQRAAVEAAGHRFHAYRRARDWDVLSRRAGPAAQLGYANVFTDRRMGDDLIDVLRIEPARRVVIDGLLAGALDGAARAGTPYTILVHSLRSVTTTTMQSGPLGLIMRVRAFDPRALYANADAQLITALRSLEPNGDSAQRATWVGPLLPAASPASAAPAPPGVLVSLSTTYIAKQRAVLQRILDALADAPVRLTVTTGPAVDPAELRSTANADVHGFLPHSRLLPSVSLVIGHGGHSTTMLALAHGLPLVVLPMNPGFDQPAIAEIVQERGAGIALPARANRRRIREAVRRILDDPSYRQSAQRLGAELRSVGGVPQAADLLEA